MLNRLKRLLNTFIDGFVKHDLTTLAAALAFYTALSLAPLVLLVVSFIGILGDGYQEAFLGQVQGLVGTEAAEALSLIIKNANSNPQQWNLSGIIGLAVLIFSASAVFAQLQSSINVIWEAEYSAQTAGWIRYLRARFFSMGIVLAFGFLALVSLVASTVLSAIFVQEGMLWSIVSAGVSLLLFSLMFTLIFKYLPDRKVHWRHVGVGGFATGFLFTVGRSVIGLYLGKSALGSAYGAAGSLIVFLAWVYYSSLIVFIGAEFTKSYFAEDADFAHHTQDQSHHQTDELTSSSSATATI